MRKLAAIVALLAGIVVTDLTLAPPVGATEVLVGNAAQYRTALTTLSADNSAGPHVVRLAADITLVADIEPTYTGVRHLIIDGDGHTIDGNDLNRAIDHQSSARLTLRDLTIRNGHTPPGNDGGAVAVDGPLTINGVTFEDNVAESNGGAVETVGGALTIVDSTFTGNSAENIAGAVEAGGGTLTISGSTFADNLVTDPILGSLGGGAVNHGGGAGTITDSMFTGNEVVADSLIDGGAVRASGSGSLTITDSTFTGNTINQGSGGAVSSGSSMSLTVSGSAFIDNRVLDADSSTNGGGAVNVDGPLTITGSEFEGNDVTNGQGGALFVDGTTATVTTSTFTDNHTLAGQNGKGGAVWSQADLLTVSDSVFTGNSTAASFADGGAVAGNHDIVIERSDLRQNATLGQSGDGGAAAVTDLQVRDSWVVDNHADATSGFGGGLVGTTVVVDRSILLRNTAEGTSGSGGAIANVNDLTVTNSTLMDNRATFGGGAISVPSGQDALLQHVTLSGNSAPTGAQLNLGSSTSTTVEASVFTAPAGGGQDCAASFGAITSGGHNRESATSCAFTQPTDGQGLTDPVVGPLRANGGPTQTGFPLNGSPLVDQIPAGDCALDEDQRGVPRPFGSGCDIGAVEQVFPEHAFTDVPNWVEDAVRWLAWTGNEPQIMVGITPTTFVAADPITRAQVVRMLYNEAGAPDPSGYPPHGFTDVPPWVEDAVRWAKGEGIVDGITPTTFVPDDPITRAQVVRMKYRFAGSPDVSSIDPHPFTDVPQWVEDAVRWAANPDNTLPLVTGITPTTFEPTDDITRGQVARMDYRLALTPAAWVDPDVAPRAMIFRAGS